MSSQNTDLVLCNLVSSGLTLPQARAKLAAMKAKPVAPAPTPPEAPKGDKKAEGGANLL